MAINYSRVVALFVLFAVTPDYVTANQVLGVPPEDDLGAVQLSTHGTIPNDPSLLRTPVNSTVDEVPLWLGGKLVEAMPFDAKASLMKLLGKLYDDLPSLDTGFDLDQEYLPLLAKMQNLSHAAVGFFAAFMSSLDKNNDRHVSREEYVNVSAILAALKTLFADKGNNRAHKDIQDFFDQFGLKLFGTGGSPLQDLLHVIEGEQFNLESIVKLLTSSNASWDATVNRTTDFSWHGGSVTLGLGVGIWLTCPKCFEGLDAPKW